MPTTIKPARQTLLPLRDERLPQRMMELSAVRDALKLDEEQIKEMIEDNQWLGWAWNIATRGARRKEYRILARCVADVMPHVGDYYGQPRPDSLPEYSLDQVVGFLFGKKRPVVYGTEFHKAFNCDAGLMINLVMENSLVRLPRTSWRKGPGGSPAIAWDEIVRFIAQRRIS